MQIIRHSGMLVALLLALLLPVLVAAQDMAEEAAPGPPVDFMVIGASYADMGDFDTDWGVRLQWLNDDHWLWSLGWNNVNTTVGSLGGPMLVDGSLWQLDLSYLLWSNDPQTSSSSWYYGVGVGARNIDADWTLGSVSNSAKRLKAAAHLVVGAKVGRLFADLRYELGEDMFGYNADGLQLSLGYALPMQRPE